MLGCALLLAALPALVGVSGVAGGGPVFAGGGAGVGAVREVAARAGEAVELRCSVLHLGDRAVSWVRSSDLQILAHGGVVFTGDARVSAARRAHDHTLRIAALRPSDAGRYECQLNTDPKMSLLFHLAVLDPPPPAPARLAVRALPPADVRAELGGAAQLACEATYAPPEDAASDHIVLQWRHRDKILGPQGGVSLETERGGGRVVSRLGLGALRRAHAGAYRCEVAGGPGAALSLRLCRRLHDDPALDILGEEEGVEEAGEAEETEMQRDEAAARGGQAAARPALAALLLTLLASL